MRELPNLTPDDVARVRGQILGALAMLHETEYWEADDVQTIGYVLGVGADLADRLFELVDEYTTIVDDERRRREQEVTA